MALESRKEEGEEFIEFISENLIEIRKLIEKIAKINKWKLSENYQFKIRDIHKALVLRKNDFFNYSTKESSQ